MTQVDELSVVTQAIVTKVRDAHGILGLPEGYKSSSEWGVFFGMEEGGFAPLPVVLVEPGSKSKELEGVSNRTTNVFRVSLLMLHCNMSEARGDVRKECLEKAELLERVLQDDLSMGGVVVHSFVTAVQAGQYMGSRGARLYSHRLEWWGLSKTRIRGNS